MPQKAMSFLNQELWMVCVYPPAGGTGSFLIPRCGEQLVNNTRVTDGFNSRREMIGHLKKYYQVVMGPVKRKPGHFFRDMDGEDWLIEKKQ